MDTESELQVDWNREWHWDDIKEWLLDRWLQLLGIVFLLIGVGFLFKYSLDHGFFGPKLRVMSGLGLGGALATVGWRIRDARRTLAHVMMGGAAATLYITFYAGSQIYDFIPHIVAFAATVGVTMATFVAAVREDSQPLAIIATLGGFATPFFLDAAAVFGSFEDIGTLAYMCVVLSGATAIYVMRGWWSLLLASGVAMWSYLALVTNGAETTAELVAAQVAVGVTLAATGLVPVLRYMLRSDEETPATHVALGAVTLVSPVVATMLTGSLWDFADTTWGLLCLAMSAVYACAAAALLRSERGRTVAVGHIVIAIGAAVAGSLLVFSGPALMLAMLAQGVVLCWLGHRAIDERGFDLVAATLAAPGHVMLSLVVVDTIAVLVEPVSGVAFVGLQGAQLFASVAALLVVGRLHDDADYRSGFEWVAHVLFLAVALHQSTALVHGDLVATAIWGGYSIALLSVATVRETVARQWMGLSGLMVAALKLLFVDMHGAETLWRVLLFIVFGIALLALSYWAPRKSEGLPSS